MSLPEAWWEVLRGLREQRARTLTTLLGLAWGTFSVVVLLAFGAGLNRLLQQRAANLGSAIAVVWPLQTTKSYDGLGRGQTVRLRAADVANLTRQVPELDLVSPEYVSWERVEFGSRVHRATLSGVYPSYAALRTWRIVAGGRFLDESDLTESRRVVVLGDRIKTALFERTDALGRTVILRGIPFTVVGVMVPKEQDSDYEGRDEDRICLPASTFERVFGARYLTYFVFRARSPALQARATDGVYQKLGRAGHFDPTDRPALSVWDTTEQDRLLSSVFLGFNLMLGGSGAFTLLVGGVGVGNLMFIRVRQRTREIGIQMALGAKPRRILWGVLNESLVLVALGGMIGFALSWMVTTLTRLTPLTAHIGEPQISPAIAALTILLLGVVALLAGFFPARRAAHLDPVLALANL